MRKSRPRAIALAVLAIFWIWGVAAGQSSASAPQTPEEKISQGCDLSKAGKTAEAATLWNAAAAELLETLKKNPQDAANQFLLGQAFFYLDRNKEALERYDKAIRLDPKNAKYHFMKGVLLRLQGSYLDAVQELVSARDLAPDQAKHWFELGEAYRAAKQPDQAMPCYQKALALDPKHAGAIFKIAVLLADRGQADEALKMFLRAAELDPKDTSPRYNAGQIYQNKELFKEAIEQFQSVIQLDASEWRARAKLVQLYQATGQTAERDAQRDALFELWKKDPPADMKKQACYCRDQFTVEGQKVMALEYFEPKGEEVIKYAFHVLDEAGRRQMRILFGYHENLDAIERDRGTLKEGEHRFHLDGYVASGAHVTWAFFQGEPTYDQVKKHVLAVISKKPDPISAFTPTDK